MGLLSIFIFEFGLFQLALHWQLRSHRHVKYDGPYVAEKLNVISQLMIRAGFGSVG